MPAPVEPFDTIVRGRTVLFAFLLFLGCSCALVFTVTTSSAFATAFVADALGFLLLDPEKVPTYLLLPALLFPLPLSRLRFDAVGGWASDEKSLSAALAAGPPVLLFLFLLFLLFDSLDFDDAECLPLLPFCCFGTPFENGALGPFSFCLDGLGTGAFPGGPALGLGPGRFGWGRHGIKS